MAVLPNRHRYLVSLADELRSQSNRVRDLIGDAHWLSDGHHKEYLLIDLLERHLPDGVLARRGFVISPTDAVSRTSEQDVLIVDTRYQSPVFNQGGLIIAFPRSVLAAISVKTTLSSQTVEESVTGLNTVRTVSTDHIDQRSTWCGAYYFEICDAVANNPALAVAYLAKAIKANPVKAPLIKPQHPGPVGPDLNCSGLNQVLKLIHGYSSENETQLPAQILNYRCNGLATAFFLAELLDHISTQRGQGDADFCRFSDFGEVQLLGDPHRIVD